MNYSKYNPQQWERKNIKRNLKAVMRYHETRNFGENRGHGSYPNLFGPEGN